MKVRLRRASDRPAAGMPEPTETPWAWTVDEFSYFRGRVRVRGWASSRAGLSSVEALFVDGKTAGRTRDVLPSPDVESVLGPHAARCRFDFTFPCHGQEAARRISLVFTADDGSAAVAGDVARPALENDPCRQLIKFFRSELEALPESGLVVEIGSRTQNGRHGHSSWCGRHRYLGVDILPGENVDVVADAHELSRHLEAGSAAAVFSISTMEHLAMPWKVAIEVNRVLRRDGLVFMLSHQSWPLHDQPWDFWRFSESAWHALFNSASGFEIVDTAQGGPVSVVAHLLQPSTLSLDEQPAFGASAVVARKTGDTDLSWDVPTETVVADTMYPARHMTSSSRLR